MLEFALEKGGCSGVEWCSGALPVVHPIHHSESTMPLYSNVPLAIPSQITKDSLCLYTTL